MGYLQALKKPKAATATPTRRTAKVDIQALLLPLEVRLCLKGATVKFEHHPMEVSSSLPPLPPAVISLVVLTDARRPGLLCILIQVSNILHRPSKQLQPFAFQY